MSVNPGRLRNVLSLPLVSGCVVIAPVRKADSLFFRIVLFGLVPRSDVGDVTVYAVSTNILAR